MLVIRQMLSLKQSKLPLTSALTGDADVPLVSKVASFKFLAVY